MAGRGQDHGGRVGGVDAFREAGEGQEAAEAVHAGKGQRKAAEQANFGTGGWKKLKAAGCRIMHFGEDWQGIACRVSKLSDPNQGIVM